MSQPCGSHHSQDNRSPSPCTGNLSTKGWNDSLRRALVLSQAEKVNICINSKYAFMVVHAHGAIWKERVLLNLGGKDVKHAKENLQLLVAVNLPDQVAIMHCPGWWRDGSQTSQGNQTADEEARQAAGGPPHLRILIPCLDLSKFKPHYTERDEEQAHEWGFSNTDPNSIWKFNIHGKILLSKALVYPILKHLHEGSYYERELLLCFDGPH